VGKPVEKKGLAAAPAVPAETAEKAEDTAGLPFPVGPERGNTVENKLPDAFVPGKTEGVDGDAAGIKAGGCPPVGEKGKPAAPAWEETKEVAGEGCWLMVEKGGAATDAWENAGNCWPVEKAWKKV